MWPTPQDYNEAIQLPQACFAEAELRRARVELNHLGLPRPMTGAFASVYRLSAGVSSWAVRCFLEQRDDTQERYEAIARALAGKGFSFFADFQFVERGIKIKSDWYPILKMEWIEGESLDQYLDRHVATPAKVVQLHRQFRDMVEHLRSAGIAHGDLQHGNILVSDEGLKLIDYDGMFVSELSGRSSHETGHRNFQHPKRANHHFFADLDNFSIWVIDLSLRALIVDPDLWKTFEGGDDCLLFRHKDFKDPDGSALFNTLISHRSKDLAQSARHFRDLIKLNPAAIPDYKADEHLIASLCHQENLATIARAEQEVFARISGEPATSMDGCGVVSQSFIDYDAWLASQLVQRRNAARAKDKDLSRLKHKAGRTWQLVLSGVAPQRWAKAIVCQGNRHYDEGNYAEAAKNYSEAMSILTSLARGEDKLFQLLPNKGWRKASEQLCSVLIQLGYCHVEQDQLGIAAHYFREAQQLVRAHEKEAAVQEPLLRATLLLAATYFKMGQPERAFLELSRKNSLQADSIQGITRAVKNERSGPYARSVTLAVMMTDLGHNHLANDEYAEALSAYRSAIECCRWLEEERREDAQLNAVITRASAGICAAKIAQNDIDECLEQFLATAESLDSLRDLVRAELNGILKSDWKFAEFMRLLGHRYGQAGEPEKSMLAFTAGLTALRLADDHEMQPMRIADCLLGLGKSTEALAVLQENLHWPEGFSKEFADHVGSGRINDLSHAILISTVVYDDESSTYHYHCIDALIAACPDRQSLSKILIALESSAMVRTPSYHRVLLDFARQLRRAQKFDHSKVVYAAALRSLKSGEAITSSGSAVMECLLAVGDLDLAAELMIDGGKMEEMVRTMINVMVGQNNYNNDSLTNLMIRVVDKLLSMPAASVTEEEIKQAIELLAWCAGEENELVLEVKERVSIWLKGRELAYAHSLVEQGKFSSAIAIFKKYGGADAREVVSAEELWVMRYLSASLIDGDRGYVSAADGYAFGCAVEVLRSLVERRCLTPAFAMQVAELIKASRAAGADRHIDSLCKLFASQGEEFAPAVSVLEKCMNKSGKTKLICPELLSAQEIGDAVMERDEADQDKIDKIFFLIEEEHYTEAMQQLDKLSQETCDSGALSELIILKGYCRFLNQDETAALQAWSDALRMSRSDADTTDSGRRAAAAAKAALCISLKYQRQLDKSACLRKLANPAISQRELCKIATQIVGKNLNEADSLTDVLAKSLLDQATRLDTVVPRSVTRDIYKAAFLVFGLMNRNCRLEVVECLDALGKSKAASLVLSLYINDTGVDSAVLELMNKIGKRHARSKKLSRLIELYESAGVSFQSIAEEAISQHCTSTISKVLSGDAPKRMPGELRQDLSHLFNQGVLSAALGARLSTAIEEGINAMESSENKERYKNDLLGIARIIERLDPQYGTTISGILESLSSAAKEEPHAEAVETELFSLAD